MDERSLEPPPCPHRRTLPRRAALGLAAAGPLAAVLARAQPEGVAPTVVPGRRWRLLLGLAAGGALDGQARVIAQRFGEIAGSPMTVENRAGASMVLAAQELMRAPPDGYTLMYAPSSVFAQNPHTLAALPYDPFTDFTPVTLVARGPLVLCVHDGVPARDARALAAWAGASRAGALSFANFGTGTLSHVYAVAFAQAAGAEVIHVPYKGAAEVARDLLEGRVLAYFDAAPSAIRLAATGRVRLLGVAAPVRSAVLPAVPTLSEQGITGIDLTSWTAVVAPAGLAPARASQIHALFTQTLAVPPVRESIQAGGYEVVAQGPQALAEEIRDAHRRFGDLIARLGMARR